MIFLKVPRSLIIFFTLLCTLFNAKFTADLLPNHLIEHGIFYLFYANFTTRFQKPLHSVSSPVTCSLSEEVIIPQSVRLLHVPIQHSQGNAFQSLIPITDLPCGL